MSFRKHRMAAMRRVIEDQEKERIIREALEDPETRLQLAKAMTPAPKTGVRDYDKNGPVYARSTRWVG